MSSTLPPQISVCILAGHGRQALAACLESLRAQSAAPRFELLVGGEMSPGNADVIAQHFPQARVFETRQLLPGGARNVLIGQARGEFLLFLDDDITAPTDLLQSLGLSVARHPEASVFGGPNDTPPESSRFQLVQGAVLASLLGSGPVSRRYGARSAGFADERWFTLCNLAVRRDVMLPFLGDLVCAEENALLAELQRRGEIMRYEPQLRVFHRRRATLQAFIEQMFKYGRGRGQLMARSPRTSRAAYLAPSALLIYLLVAPALVAIIHRPLVALMPGLVYLALTIASGIRVGWTLGRLREAPMATALIWSVHVCYGAGVLRGLIPWRVRKRADGPAGVPGRIPVTEDS